MVGPTGRVVGLDFSDALVVLAKRRSETSSVTFSLGDAQVDRAPGAPFDVAASQFGVMFFEDPVAAFANIASQLAPGGRLGFSCWQRVEDNPWWLTGVLAGFLTEPPRTPPTAGPFSLCDPERVATLLGAAG